VKTDRYRRVVVKLYSLPYFFRFRIEADSVWIRIWNQSLSVTNTDQIWSEYGLVVDKHFVGSLVDNKVKLACNFFYIQEYTRTPAGARLARKSGTEDSGPGRGKSPAPGSSGRNLRPETKVSGLIPAGVLSQTYAGQQSVHAQANSLGQNLQAIGAVVSALESSSSTNSWSSLYHYKHRMASGCIRFCA
jgi:hypothetical protein